MSATQANVITTPLLLAVNLQQIDYNILFILLILT